MEPTVGLDRLSREPRDDTFVVVDIATFPRTELLLLRMKSFTIVIIMTGLPLTTRRRPGKLSGDRAQTSPATGTEPAGLSWWLGS